MSFGNNRRHRMRREHDRRAREQLFWSITFGLFAITMIPFGIFMIANCDAISLVTHDGRSLIGQLGVIAVVSGFFALMAIPLQYALGE